MNPVNLYRMASFIFLTGIAVPCGTIFSLDMPESIHLSDDGTRLIQGGVTSSGFYDETILRTVSLNFSQTDYWQQMVNNYSSEINIPADLSMEDTTYPSVGVRFKGFTSYSQTGNSLKKSFNIETDFADSTQKIMKYKTLNLNNCFSDASFLREVLYFNICRNYVPCPKANFVKLTINGENWGIYANVQQINNDFIKEWFFGKEGDRWKAPMAMTNTGGMQRQVGKPAEARPDTVRQPGGGTPPGGGTQPGGRTQPGGGMAVMNGGDCALSWLGSNVSLYQSKYELKYSGTSNPWEKLVATCDVLNNAPLASLADSLDVFLDIDRCLWFLAVENIFTDEDSYLTKGADYFFFTDEEHRRINLLEYDGNESFKINDVTTSPVFGEAVTTRPLISRLLSVPELRQRYLAHVRTIISESLDWNVLQPRIEAYRTLIGTEIKADTLKLTTNTAFDSSLVDLKNFVDTRRNFLLTFSEINRTAPEITAVAGENLESESGASLPGNGIRVTANVACASGVGSVLLHYCSGLTGAFTDSLMYDDGLHGDGAAGDEVYGGIIPPQTVGNMVRYYVEARASDTYATASFAPAGAEHDVYVRRIEATVSHSTAIVINELMSGNEKTVQDPQGEYGDWIELKNISDQEADLSGMFLSDDESNLLKWAIPEGTILLPGDRLVIWADDDEGDTPGLHASFNLSGKGETVFLVDTPERGNAILDSVSYEPLETDYSYGRIPDGVGAFEVLSTPTPGDANTIPTGISDYSFPKSFHLEQNFPNPFNSSTTIGFSLPEAVDIDLSVFNLLGQKVCTLQYGRFNPGTYQVRWTGRNAAGEEMASGVYLLRLMAGPYSKMHRLVMLR